MKIRRLIPVFVALVIFVVYSAALVMDMTGDKSVIRRIFNIKEVPVEKTIIKTVYVEKEVIREVHWYQFHATGYSPDDPSQGTNRIMSSGNEVYEGAVATDPFVIPTGTKLEIRGLPNGRDGIYTAEDTGDAIKGLEIDIFRESKFEALQINQMIWVRILKEGE